jgi:tetratricopeptide (TPR) repeat protein
MTVIDQLIRNIEAAKGGLHAKAAVAAEFFFSAFPEVERTPLRATLDAAVVLRWFDAGLLAQMLKIPQEEAAQRYKELKAMPFVERFPGREEFSNVHEATRLGWRKQLAHKYPEHFKALSMQAVHCFSGSSHNTDKIEWIYQLLCAEPDQGATELEMLNREWSSARPEERYALAAALKEHDDLGLVSGRALVWIRLVRAWTQEHRIKAADLVETAQNIWNLIVPSADLRAQADAQCLLGDGFQTLGKLTEAHRAFNQYLALSQRLVEQDPSNAGWQHDLAVAHSRVGDVLQDQGKLTEAHGAFNQYLSISQRLAEQDPSNAGWQRDLEVALSKVGDVLKARGKLAEAHEAFNQCLSISQKLVQLDLSNAEWQRELAVAHSRVGDVLQAQEKLVEAHGAFNHYLAISQRLAQLDLSNAEWQRDLAVAYSKVGDILNAQGKLVEADGAFNHYLAISQKLAEQDPSNAGWQRDLAEAHARVGDVLQGQGKLLEAHAAFTQSLAISQKLAEQDPSNAGWQRDLALAFLRLARLKLKGKQHHTALQLYEEAGRIYKTLTRMAPKASIWKKEQKKLKAELAYCRSQQRR